MDLHGQVRNLDNDCCSCGPYEIERTETLPPRVALPPKLQAALATLRAEPLNGLEKGLPPVRLALGEIGHQGWNVLRGDVPLPVMALRQADLDHNVRLLQAYGDFHGAWLAPHGKTTMAPQLMAAQLAAGSWAISVGNVAQIHVCRAFGLQRLLVANEMVFDYDTTYLAQQLRDDLDFEPYVFVDSEDGVGRLGCALECAGVTRPLSVFVELGMPGGRCGVREVASLVDLAEAVTRAAPRLRLAGVAGYEGLVQGTTHAERTTKAGHYLATLAEAVHAVRPLAGDDEPFFVTAGGSIYLDQVVATVGRSALPEAQLILRPGRYITHDSCRPDQPSPARSGARGAPSVEAVRPALEIWSTVLSRPESGLAILGMGLRDMSIDLGYPIPLWRSRSGGAAEPIDRDCTLFRANDQHAYLYLPSGVDLQVGDLVACGVTHPCTALDKWRLLLVVDEQRNIIDAVRTFF